VFHYQNEEGQLRLLRDGLADFLGEYALAGNRRVHALRIGVSEETARLLRDGFAARQRAAARQQDRLVTLRAERALLEQAASGGRRWQGSCRPQASSSCRSRRHRPRSRLPHSPASARASRRATARATSSRAWPSSATRRRRSSRSLCLGSARSS
jgi:hypothetical protein